MLKNCAVSEFDGIVSGRRVIAFGAGKMLRQFLADRLIRPEYVVDSDPLKNNSFISDVQMRVFGWDHLLADQKKEDVYLITPLAYEGIYERLKAAESLWEHDIYVLSLMNRAEYDKERDSYERKDIVLSRHSEAVIPKKIHYFWFSGDEMPEEIRRCVESWQRFCPDYEIIKWDMKTYDYRKNRFCREAMDNRKWAFASDYARADVIYEHGGIYLDVDVELVKNLDTLLGCEAFIGFESNSWVDPGSGFGAAAGNPIVKEFRDIYFEKPFLLPDGSFDMVECPKKYTRILSEHGLVLDGSFQELDHIAVFPYDYFCPHSYMTGKIFLSDHSYSIHHHEGSWHNDKQKEAALKDYSYLKEASENQ